MFQSINIHSSVAVYVQIENTVQFAVASGRLKAGDRLPSVREAADMLNVNPNTVAKSYRDLEIMGVVYTRRGMGVFISKGADVKCKEDTRRRLVGRLHEIVSEATAAGMTGQEIKAICNASCAIDAQLYGETPASLLAMAKPKKS
jgi:GntR family transcriptional regulator